MKLLIIRPEPGASASAARAKAAGFDPVVLPFFEVRAQPWKVPEGADYDALLLTSANAVRHAGAGLAALATLPCYCVGERTAAAARSFALDIAYQGGSDVDEIIAAAAQDGRQSLVWLAGADHRPLAPPQDVRIDTHIVYASEALELPEDAPGIIAGTEAVALHSARAARQFAATIDRLQLDRVRFLIAAFSPAIAEAAGQGWRGVVTAAEPQDSALLSALAAHGRDSRTIKEI